MQSGIIVQKYGGSSVATPERLRRVARRVIDARRAGHRVVVVVSARGDTTDELLDLASQVSRRPSGREMDVLLSTGEQVSIALLAMAIEDQGEQAISLTGAQVGIITDDAHRRAKIQEVRLGRISQELERGKIVVVAGFQGVNRANDITTLGRGGSDTTAVALAAALRAVRCEIYTDVDGIYTADPRLVPEAARLDVIGYNEMLEMASLGAQVMQLRSVEYAKLHGVEIHVLSSFLDGNCSGTVIKEVGTLNSLRPVTAVAHDTKVAKIVILGVPDKPGIAFRLFDALAARGINVDMIIQGATRDGISDIAFTVARDDLEGAAGITAEVSTTLGAGGVVTDADIAKVSIVGAGIASNPGVAATMFAALAEKDINIQMISTSEIKISVIIAAADAARAARAIHARFNLGEREMATMPA